MVDKMEIWMEIEEALEEDTKETPYNNNQF